MIGSTFVRKKLSIIDNHMAVAKWNLGYCFPQSCIWRLTVNGGPGGRVDWRAVFPIKIHEFLSCRQDGCKTGRAVEEGELMGCRKRLAHVQHIGPPCCAAHRPALSAARQPALLWWPPAHPVVLAAGTPFFKARQRRPESLFQTPTPLLFQNFWIRVWLFFKFENPTPDQNPVTIIDPIVIYSSICLRNDHTDSCYCRNGKVTSDPGPGFSQIFDSESGSGHERKTQNPAGVESGTPDPVPPLFRWRLSPIFSVFNWLSEVGLNSYMLNRKGLAKDQVYGPSSQPSLMLAQTDVPWIRYNNLKFLWLECLLRFYLPGSKWR